MKIGKNETSEKVFIIAEIGNNHEGNIELAEKMIVEAARSGADAVKFQTFRTHLYVNPEDEARVQRLKKFELTFKQFEQLAKVAQEEDVGFLSTPFDLESAAFLSNIVDAFKIGSGENTFYPLIDCVAAGQKPIIMSSGIAELSEVKHVIERIQNIWKDASYFGELAILHCVSSYPTPPEEASLNSIPLLIEKLRVNIGYSDHTLGVEAAALSVALGARIIEKHFTLDKNYSNFRDHQLSADPAEFRELVNRIRYNETLLGKKEKIRRVCEEGASVSMRRSIVVNHDMKEGSVIKWEDLAWTRPAGGFAPGEEDLVVGKILNVDLRSGQRLLKENIR